MANDGKSRMNERTGGEMEYLKEKLGSVLVESLAEICVQKPADPIEYLEHWLHSYNEKRREIQAVEGAGLIQPKEAPNLKEAGIPMSRNPFLIDLVIEIMLEEAYLDTLKPLREINSNWNQLGLKELGKRADQNQLKKLNFDKEWFKEEFDWFLESTATIPQLFRSFELTFPESLKNINFTFFKKYSPMFLQLKINEKLKFTDSVTNYLRNFFTWIAPTLQKLNVERSGYPYSNEYQQPVIPFSVPAHFQPHLVFPNLTEIIWKLTEYKKSDIKHFQFILDRSRAIDPTPNLTSLENIARNAADFFNLNGHPLTTTALSRWSQLTNLSIHEPKDKERIIATFLSLGQTGMSLKKLSMTLFDIKASFENCQNLSRFLSTQAKSIQVLDFYCTFTEISEEIVEGKLVLPIFEAVHTLSLYVNYYMTNQSEDFRLFEMGPISIHFPKLENLGGEPVFLEMIGDEYDPFKTLFVCFVPDTLLSWSTKFPSVESLTCKGKILGMKNARLPWKESLKILKIDHVSFPLKVSHLTNLRKFVVIERDLNNLSGEYLDCFRQALSLKLSSIIFKLKKEPSDEVKARIVRHFPYPVEFQECKYYFE